jgi:hypothetical protein
VTPKQSTDLRSNFSQPIPIQLLVLESTNDDPVIKSSVKSVGAVTTGKKTTANTQNSRLNQIATHDLELQNTLEYAQSNNSVSVIPSVREPGSAPSNDADPMLMYPFRLKHLGNPDVTPYTLVLHKIGKIGVIRSSRLRFAMLHLS